MARPPIGIAVLGFFALMAGFAYFLAGLRWTGAIVFGPVETGNGVALTGMLALVTGIIYVAAGAALMALRPWAWLFAMIVSAFGLFEAVLVVFATGSLAAGFGAALLPGIVLWYLNSDDVKAAFVEANSVPSDLAEATPAEATPPEAGVAGPAAPATAMAPTNGPDGPANPDADG